MSNMIETDLEGIIIDIKQLDWKQSVYLESIDPIGAKTKALVLDADNVEWADDDFTPIAVFNRGFIEFISIDLIKSVVENLEKQKTGPTLEEKIAAAIYYFKEDAYLNLGA